MKYIPRLEIPEINNPYYNTKANGGYSNAIIGKVKSTGKSQPGLNVLANCVGYAYGRFNEIGNYKSCKYLKPVNAENFPSYIGDLKTGLIPKLGAVVVWQKGKTLKSTDGAGHVAIVEKIYSDGSILISQSGYNSKAFWTEKVEYNNGKYLCSWMGSSYTFRCFIYHPIEFDTAIETSPMRKGSSGNLVKELQNNLKTLGYKLSIDGSFGSATEAAVKDFQKKYNLTVDGIVGDKTLAKLNEILNCSELSIFVNDILKPNVLKKVGDEYYIKVSDLDDLGIAKNVSLDETIDRYKIKTV